MRERCPLVNIAFDGEIPSICRTQCGPIWDEAVQSQQPYVDDYNTADEVDCIHVEHTIEFSSEALQASDNAGRSYTINNECGGCTNELYADIWTFVCKHVE